MSMLKQQLKSMEGDAQFPIYLKPSRKKLNGQVVPQLARDI